MLCNTGDAPLSIQQIEDTYFLDPDHRLILTAMRSILDQAGRDGAPVRLDPVIISQTLKADHKRTSTANGMPFVQYLVLCESECVTPSNLFFHYRRVRDHAIRVALIDELRNVALNVKKDEPIDTIAKGLEAAHEKLVKSSSTNTVSRPIEMAEEVWIELQRDLTGGNKGIMTGFKPLDAATGGLQRGELTYLAARPSVGKSAFALHLARTACLDNRSVLLISLEMNKTSLIQRLMSNHCSVPFSKIRNHDLNQTERKTIWDGLAEFGGMWPLHVVDKPGASANDVLAATQEIISKGGLDLLIVDYLQIMDGKRMRNESRQEEVSRLSSRIKAMTLQFGISTVCLSQLSRAAETEARPQLHHLRESGSIEQDADVVLFLHCLRPGTIENEWKSGLELILAKNKNGPAGVVVDLWMLGQYQRFIERHERIDPPAKPKTYQRAAGWQD